VKRKKQSKETSSDIAFRYFENLRHILRDLQTLDGMIPAETSRYGLGKMDEEARAIINARKVQLLDLIQTMCRDHMKWGNKLLADGWAPEHKGKFSQKQDYRRWNYIG
jgi:hypothetical protein